MSRSYPCLLPSPMNHAPHSPTFRLEHAQLSDLGMRRSNNQDAVAVVVTDDLERWRQRGHLLIVADGMGAHAAGELASQLAVEQVPHTYFKLRDLSPPAALRQAIRDANAVVHSKGQSALGFQGMGTTCSCLVLLPYGALVAHIGDSRVYRLRDQELSQLTFDHSLVWEMAAAGHMAEEDVPAYIPKNVITRSLGPHDTVNVDLEGPFDAAVGDIFLLCSDGLSGQVSDDEIGALMHCLVPPEAVQTLVDLANLRGGPDNISVIVARIVGEPDGPATAGPAGGAAAGQAGTVRLAASLGCLLVLAFCLINGYWLAAGMAAAALATSVGWLWRGRDRRRSISPTAASIGGPYGNGPYRQTPAEPSDVTVDTLGKETDRLRSLAGERNLAVDWSAHDRHVVAARTAAEAGDRCEAVRHLSAAIRDTMQQIRQPPPVDDPTVDDSPPVE